MGSSDAQQRGCFPRKTLTDLERAYADFGSGSIPSCARSDAYASTAAISDWENPS